jgi:hypothetical protein
VVKKGEWQTSFKLQGRRIGKIKVLFEQTVDEGVIEKMLSVKE